MHGGRVTTSRPGRGINRPIAVTVLILLAAGGAYALYSMIPSGAVSPSGAEGASNSSNTPPTSPIASNPPRPKSLLDPLPRSPAAETPRTGTPSPTGTTTGGTPTPASPIVTPPQTPSGVAGVNDQTKPGPVDVTSPNLQPPSTAQGAGSPGGPSEPLNSVASTVSVRTLMEAGEQAFAAGRLVEARVNFSRAYLDKDCGPADQDSLREKLTAINRDLVFSPKVTPGDPLVESYTVQAGDVLDKIRKRRELTVESKFIARINGMANANNLKVGQKLKLVRGPFHAVVHKNEFRMDVFAGSPDEPETWTYIRSFAVGLGEEKSGTPSGTFRIRNKMANPAWRNPKTGESFGAEDPKNPIGEYWLGWEGVGDAKVYTGFGLHGTIDPSSIGQAKSMGCVRLGPDDIAMVFEMMSEQVSVVKVTP
ncbi:Putative L,D-transpeptidase YkuD [Phycisphaerales bacterium]|nr:Putative L,D-transpeptidase YkuD [Phycisphaerales bacterium]